MAHTPRAQLQQSFQEISKLNHILGKDTMRSFSAMKDVVLRFDAGEKSKSLGGDACFLIKTTIRAFLGQVDGLGYALRRAVLSSAEDAGLVLTQKERAKLSEKRYDSKTNTLTDKRALLNTPESIKVGFEYFPRLVGTTFNLDTSGDGWRGFKRLVRVRNGFTHPKTIEDLSVTNSGQALQPTLAWFSSQAQNLVIECGRAMGVSLASAGVLDAKALKYRESEHPWVTIFRDEDYELIAADAGRALEYIKTMLRLSSEDTLRALTLMTRKDFPMFSYEWEYATRMAVRTMFSDVEAITAAAQFFTDAAARRGDIPVHGLLDKSDGDEIEDKFATALTRFSAEFGNETVLPTSGDSWKAFRGARFLRNRLTHPKAVGDLRVELKNFQLIHDALGYFLGAHDALFIDAEKWASLASSVGKAIKERHEATEQRDSEDEEELSHT